jgi:hypothetical protein
LKHPADILDTMAATFRERNATYGDNYTRIGPTLALLYPDGITLKTPDDFVRFHFIVLIVVKLTRFTSSGSTHIDSVHDLGVYAAMLESFLPSVEAPTHG